MNSLTETNLRLLHRICTEKRIPYELASVSPNVPGEALIDCGNAYNRKLLSHEFQKKGFFVSKPDPNAPSLLSVFLATKKNIFDLKKEGGLNFANIMANLILFIAENLLGIKTINPTIGADNYTNDTKVIKLTLSQHEMQVLWKTLTFMNFHRAMFMVPIDNALYLVLSKQIEKQVYLQTLDKHKLLVEEIRGIVEYVFVLPATMGKLTLRINLGNEEGIQKVIKKLEQKYPTYQFSYPYSLQGNKILQVEGVVQQVYREMYLQNPAPFSIEDYLLRKTNEMPSIEKVLDILKANVPIANFDKHPKSSRSKKNNLFVGFHSIDDATLAKKVLTSAGILIEDGKSDKTVKVPVLETFGLYSKDKVSVDPKKNYIEEKYRKQERV